MLPINGQISQSANATGLLIIIFAAKDHSFQLFLGLLRNYSAVECLVNSAV